MMETIGEFASRFEATLSLEKEFMIKKQNRYFLLNRNLKKLLSKQFFYAGIYLGKVKGGAFFPSFNLLAMIAEKEANKIMVDGKTEWLFICGRDIFRQGITRMMGSRRKGDYSLVLNSHGECLGFGRILRDLDEEREGVVLKNVSDIGDFLRREQKSLYSERSRQEQTR
jgi:ribosome biogenesis protein Nip4